MMTLKIRGEQLPQLILAHIGPYASEGCLEPLPQV